MFSLLSIGKGLICLLSVLGISKGMDTILEWVGTGKRKEKGMGVES